jgi:hypothetical protein
LLPAFEDRVGNSLRITDPVPAPDSLAGVPDYWIVPEGVVSGEDLVTPNYRELPDPNYTGTYCDLFDQLDRTVGAVSARPVVLEFRVQGLANAPVALTDMVATATARSNPVSGVHMTCTYGGAGASTQFLFFDVSESEPAHANWRTELGASDPPQPFGFTLDRMEREWFRAILSSQDCDCDVTLHLKYEVDGNTKSTSLAGRWRVVPFEGPFFDWKGSDWALASRVPEGHPGWFQAVIYSASEVLPAYCTPGRALTADEIDRCTNGRETTWGY